MKYSSKIIEKILMIDTREGTFWDFTHPELSIFDPTKIKDYAIIKITHYHFNSFDFKRMREVWRMLTSDINYYSYEQYIYHEKDKYPLKESNSFKIIRTDRNKITILKRDDPESRIIQTEDDIISMNSLDDEGQYFNIKIDPIDDSIITDFYERIIQPKYPALPPAEANNIGHEIEVYHDKIHEEKPLMIITTPELSNSILECLKKFKEKRQQYLQPKEQDIIPNPTPTLDIKIDNEFRVTKFMIAIFAILLFLIGVWLQPVKKIFKKGTKVEDIKMIDANILHTKPSDPMITETQKIKVNSDDTKKSKKTSLNNMMIFSKEILGLGSQGTIVYNGEYQSKNVAIKRFLKNYTEFAKSEVEILIHTNHKNIVKYYHYEEDDNFMYLILERCLCSVKELVDSFKKVDKSKANESKFKISQKNVIRSIFTQKYLSESELKSILRDCSEGIKFLHEQNIIHRDIKPENILISQDKTAKLTDFGISRLLNEDETKFLTEVGSIGWKAPEILLKLPKTKSVDIFSLGCTFYYILTGGMHPFGEIEEREQNIINSLYKIENIPFEIEHLIEKMIFHDPKIRYDINEVLKHPYFWEEYQKLDFLQELSDYIESSDPRYGKLLEEFLLKNHAVPESWNKILDSCLV